MSAATQTILIIYAVAVTFILVMEVIDRKKAVLELGAVRASMDDREMEEFEYNSIAESAMNGLLASGVCSDDRSELVGQAHWIADRMIEHRNRKRSAARTERSGE